MGAGQITAVWVQDSGPLAQPVVRSRPLGAAGTLGQPDHLHRHRGVGYRRRGKCRRHAGDLAAVVRHVAVGLLSREHRPLQLPRHLRVGAAGVGLGERAPGHGRRAATGADGTLAVTWESRLPGIDGYYTSARTLAAIRPPGASWGAESLLSDPDIEGRYPHLGVGPDGTTTVVWESYDGANEQVATRVRQGGHGSRSRC